MRARADRPDQPDLEKSAPACYGQRTRPAAIRETISSLTTAMANSACWRTSWPDHEHSDGLPVRFTSVQASSLVRGLCFEAK